MTTYPAQIDTSASLPSVVDNVTPVSGASVNRLRDTIIAVEAELGVKPSGTFTTVRQRLDTIEQLFTLNVVTLNGDLGGTSNHPLVIGLQGRPVSSAAPSVNQSLVWNGVAWAPASSVQLAQDLGNTSTAPYVIGLQGRPVSNQAPTNNQVLTWNGSVWLPTTQTITLNILPTVTLLPAEIIFLGGDGYNGTSSPFRLGARQVDMSSYPATTGDGRVRTMTLKADMEVTNAAATGYVILKDTTSNAIVATGPTLTVTAASNSTPIQITTSLPNSLVTGQAVTISGVTGNTAANGFWIITVVNSTQFTLNSSVGNANYINGGLVSTPLSTSSLSSVELSAAVTSGNFAGVMRTDQTSMYEVQAFILNGGLTDQVICRNARLSIAYSPPVNPTNLLALAMPTDINFISGTELNGFTTPAGMGGRVIDMSLFPASQTDGSGRNRLVEFFIDAEVSAAGVDGYCQLFDTDHNVVVTNTNFHFTNTTAAEIHSVPLAVGSTPGMIRSDTPTRYEVQLWKVSNSVADRVILNNARITIFYL